MKKTLNEEDWKKLGMQARAVETELFMLHVLSSGYMPVGIVKHIHNAIKQISKYKCEAEDRMLQSGVSDDLTIFYGSHSHID
jgi:hypothetical protein